jgi:hypothetical protein
VTRERREGGWATVSALVLVALALLVAAGVRVLGDAVGDKLRCHGDAVAAIDGFGRGSRCVDSGRPLRAAERLEGPAVRTSAPRLVRVTAGSASEWLSRFGRAASEGFAEGADALADVLGGAWQYGTRPSRWRESGAWLRRAAVRDARFLATDPLGALWSGVVTDARIARDVWLGLGQWMVDTGAALVSGNAERMGRSVGELGFDGLSALVTEGAGLALRPAVKATVIAIGPRGLGAGRRLRFAQTTASAAFSADGTFAGETIESLAAKLRAGTISPADVPVRYVTIEGNDLIDNTRSALALRRAGIPQSSWTLVDATATDTAAIEARLIKNGLTAEGTDVLRITGAGPAASSFR